jgi:hypothetical protein
MGQEFCFAAATFSTNTTNCENSDFLALVSQRIRNFVYIKIAMFNSD